MSVTPTQSLAGRYRVLRTLASGGMGTVLLAEDERLGRQVAIKRMRAEGTASEGLQRFRREARIGASLSHPHLVRIYDAIVEGPEIMIVMEYVPGRSLAELLREGRPDHATTISVLRDTAAGLDHAHQHGVVHRDVKPGNILLTEEGRAKLGDLGIATAAESTRITTTGRVLGTAAYLAPEQLDGRPATSYWASLDHLVTLGTGIEVRPHDRYVDDGNVVTASGVSAGIDMALHLVRRFNSEERAREVRRFIQYDPEPPV